LRGRTRSVLDLGCGFGLTAFYLRECGHAAAILGVDFDERKIELARNAAQHDADIAFLAGDARETLPEHHDVVILDLLQYVDTASRQTILMNVARGAGEDAMVVIRQGIRDGSWRHRFTALVDALGRLFRWMKGEQLRYPTREEIVRPLWGRTPFNNYLFVFRRRAVAHRQE
jgi:SAM-dependent methyltransferase